MSDVLSMKVLTAHWGTGTAPTSPWICAMASAWCLWNCIGWDWWRPWSLVPNKKVCVLKNILKSGGHNRARMESRCIIAQYTVLPPVLYSSMVFLLTTYYQCLIPSVVERDMWGATSTDCPRISRMLRTPKWMPNFDNTTYLLPSQDDYHSLYWNPKSTTLSSSAIGIKETLHSGLSQHVIPDLPIDISTGETCSGLWSFFL